MNGKICLILVIVAICCFGSTDALFSLTKRKYYVGGSFVSAYNASEAVTNVNYITSWNGVEWANLNNGTNGPVYAVHFDSCYTLYIGGAFTTAGGVHTGPIAQYYLLGKNWITIGSSAVVTDPSHPSSVTATVRSISTDCVNKPTGSTCPCDIYIGGKFAIPAPGDSGIASNFAVYKSNDQKWFSLGGVQAHKSNVAIHTIYAVYKKEGSALFGLATAVQRVWIAGDTDGFVKYYDTSAKTWYTPDIKQSTTNVIATPVVYSFYYNSVTTDSDEVYIGGNFNFLDSKNNQCAYICRIVVTVQSAGAAPDFALSALGTDSYTQIRGVVNAIHVYNDATTTNVFIGGLFTGSTLSNVARLTASKDSAVGTWMPISSNDANTVKSQIKAIYACGKATIDCLAGSVAVGGASSTSTATPSGAFINFYNENDKTWNNFGRGLSNGEVLAITSVIAAGSTSVVSAACIVAVCCVTVLLAFF